MRLTSRSLNRPNLLRALAERGLTTTDIGRLAGLSEPTMSRAVRGEPISPSTLVAITRALAATPLLEGVEALLAGEPV
jgi:transcriptional regulator with XRE-family HTH domain